MSSELGSFLKQLRLDRNMTLREVENKVNISNGYLSQIESGKRGIPTIGILMKLSEVYGVSFGTFVIKLAEEVDKSQGIEPPFKIGIPLPESAFISRNYENLSENGKRSLKDYLLYLIDREKKTDPGEKQ